MSQSEQETRADLPAAWDGRVARLLGILPTRVTAKIHWLRHPDRRIVRAIAGILFVLGGIFSILPVLGLWMLPVGLALLAEDWPGLKPWLERSARFCERLWQRIRPKSASRTPISPPKR